MQFNLQCYFYCKLNLLNVFGMIYFLVDFFSDSFNFN